MIKNSFLALTLLFCFSHSAHANISEWTGIYRGVGVVEESDGKRNEIQCELQIIEDNSQKSSEVLTVKYSQGAAVIRIVNLGGAPKHLTQQVTETALNIAPLFAHPISIKLQKEPGGFNETLIVGDLVESSSQTRSAPLARSSNASPLAAVQKKPEAVGCCCVRPSASVSALAATRGAGAAARARSRARRPTPAPS